jgi:hypothetical protein
MGQMFQNQVSAASFHAVLSSAGGGISRHYTEFTWLERSNYVGYVQMEPTAPRKWAHLGLHVIRSPQRAGRMQCLADACRIGD